MHTIFSSVTTNKLLLQELVTAANDFQIGIELYIHVCMEVQASQEIYYIEAINVYIYMTCIMTIICIRHGPLIIYACMAYFFYEYTTMLYFSIIYFT